MNPAVEDLVVEFLELRERVPGYPPEEFARSHPVHASALLSALHSTLAASDLLPQPLADTTPQLIGPYRVLRTIGRGGMGVVYEVERDSRHFALKWLPLAAALGPRLQERLRREARILALLDDPHIVRMHDSGIHEGTPYLVMELVDGRPLLEVAPGLDRTRRVRLVVLLCRAAHAAHTAGVVHRDLKPQNVLVRGDDDPVLLDFGLGVAEELPTLTSTGDLLGTPRYMAPEQIRDGAGAVDARTDVHALGLLLYEVLLAQPAFPDASRERVLSAIVRSRFRRPRRVQRDLPAPLERIVLTAMAWSPHRRFATAAAMADDLDRFLAGQPVRARPPGPLARGLHLLAVEPARAVAALLAVLLLAGLAWWSTRQTSLTDAQRLEVAAHYSRGIASWLDGAPDDAARALQSALALQPDLGGAAALMGFVQERQDGADSATAGPLLQRLASRVAGLPDDALTAAVEGLVALDRRDFSHAENELTAAARALPPTRRLAEALGDVHRRLERPAEAEQDYRAALAVGPESARLWSRLAEVYLDLQNPDAGIEAAEHAIRLSGQRTGRIALTLAMLYNSRRDFDKAEALLRELLQHSPNDANAHYLLAFSLDSQHRAECAASYRRAIAIAPDHTRALLSLANVHAGADRGHCAGCDRLYAQHPELLDVDAATRLVIATLDSKHGGQRATVLQLVDVARKLPDRAPILVHLRALTDGKEKTPDVLNFDWLRRELETREGGQGR